MIMRDQNLKNKQNGVTLIEMLTAISIMASVITGVAVLTKQHTDNTKASVTALHLKTVGEAASEYIKANYTAISAQATTTMPALIRISDLSAGDFLPAGFEKKNPFGQDTCILVLKQGTNKLNGLVVTEKGTEIDDLSLGQIASEVGAAGGGVYSTDATTFRGTMGGWNMPFGNYAAANHLGQNCASAAGNIALTKGHPVMALWFADGQDVSGTLYRNAVPGNPSLNTMETPILMGAGTIVSKGDACTTTGAIARDDPDGKLMVCTKGKWTPSGGLNWKGFVDNVGDLPAFGNDAGDTWRIQNLANHAFTWDDEHNVWQGLTVESDGSFYVPGIIFANGSSSNYGAVTMQGEKNGWSGMNFKMANGNNAGTLIMSPQLSGFYKSEDNNWRWFVDNDGNSEQLGRVRGGKLQATNLVADGDNCSADDVGSIARSAKGELFSCQAISSLVDTSCPTIGEVILAPDTGETLVCI